MAKDDSPVYLHHTPSPPTLICWRDRKLAKFGLHLGDPTAGSAAAGDDGHLAPPIWLNCANAELICERVC